MCTEAYSVCACVRVCACVCVCVCMYVCVCVCVLIKRDYRSQIKEHEQFMNNDLEGHKRVKHFLRRYLFMQIVFPWVFQSNREIVSGKRCC